MMTADLHYLTISELAPMIERGEISPVEVTRHMLDRIEKIEGELRAYARVMSDSAIDQAKQAESEIAARTGLNVIAVEHASGGTTNPPADTELPKDGELVMIGTAEQHLRFRELFT